MLPIPDEWKCLTSFSSSSNSKYIYTGTVWERDGKRVRIFNENSELAAQRKENPDAFMVFIRQMYSPNNFLILRADGRVEGWRGHAQTKVYEEVATESRKQELSRFLLKLALSEDN